MKKRPASTKIQDSEQIVEKHWNNFENDFENDFFNDLPIELPGKIGAARLQRDAIQLDDIIEVPQPTIFGQ